MRRTGTIFALIMSVILLTLTGAIHPRAHAYTLTEVRFQFTHEDGSFAGQGYIQFGAIDFDTDYKLSDLLSIENPDASFLIDIHDPAIVSYPIFASTAYDPLNMMGWHSSSVTLDWNYYRYTDPVAEYEGHMVINDNNPFYPVTFSDVRANGVIPGVILIIDDFMQGPNYFPMGIPSWDGYWDYKAAFILREDGSWEISYTPLWYYHPYAPTWADVASGNLDMEHDIKLRGFWSAGVWFDDPYPSGAPVPEPATLLLLGAGLLGAAGLRKKYGRKGH